MNAARTSDSGKSRRDWIYKANHIQIFESLLVTRESQKRLPPQQAMGKANFRTATKLDLSLNLK